MRTRIPLIALTAIISIVCASQRISAEDNAVQKGKEKAMSVKLQWFGHASFKISSGSDVIYIDPWKLKDTPHDATLVLVSHSHYDHYSAEDITKVSGMTTKLVAAEDVIQKQGKGQTLKPGQSIDVNGIKITGVPAYNLTKQFHPKSNNWLGFVIEIAGKRIYYAGDTDLTDEMKALKNIDLALLPAGGTYTMNAAEAAEATRQFKPKQAIPYHWGDIVGSQADADNFKKDAACPVQVLKPGESITVD
ncbi:MAG: MBL fold metallo-hydrolase [Sedimentisphaerales bacterium]|jgi:L-ascorbate metabolism protein UlaG (beta-lactamase superfamily)